MFFLLAHAASTFLLLQQLSAPALKKANQSECGTLIKDQWEQPLVSLESD